VGPIKVILLLHLCRQVVQFPQEGASFPSDSPDEIAFPANILIYSAATLLKTDSDIPSMTLSNSH
jgi:hypothetical protein